MEEVLLNYLGINISDVRIQLLDDGYGYVDDNNIPHINWGEDVECRVTKGIVAPKFLSDGGAIQFMHKQPLRLECEDGYLQEDFSWIQKNI